MHEAHYFLPFCHLLVLLSHLFSVLSLFFHVLHFLLSILVHFHAFCSFRNAPLSHLLFGGLSSKFRFVYIAFGHPQTIIQAMPNSTLVRNNSMLLFFTFLPQSECWVKAGLTIFGNFWPFQSILFGHLCYMIVVLLFFYFLDVTLGCYE